MRIISGKYRGMKLAGFEGTEIRPTADRVKESLFNILYGRIAGTRVLDLFCGSGSLGIECLSRGAEFVHFNDISSESTSLLKKNLKKLGEENFAVTNTDYSSCLARAGKFDLIFIDPPYKLDIGIRAIETIGASGLLLSGGTAVFERDRPFEGTVGGLEILDERKYGKTYLTCFGVSI